MERIGKMTINSAIIGLGYIGKVHLETLMRLPDVKVVAVSDVDADRASKIAEENSISHCTDDYRTFINDPNIDVVHNCTPNHLHFQINKTLLENDKHVFSEKPLSLTQEQALELCRLADKHERITGVNFCYRYYPSVQEAAVRIKNGEIGIVHSVFGSYFQDWLLYETDYNWRLNKKYAGESNTMADIGSHWLDLVQFVSGAKITEVMADLNTIHPMRKKPKSETRTFDTAFDAEYQDVNIELDDYGSVLLHLDNGGHGAFSVCQLSAGRKCSIDLQMYGTKASLAWNHESPTKLWLGHRDQPNQILFENPDLFHEDVKKFSHLPAGHPQGYYDAFLNLFSEFYTAIKSHFKNEKANINIPTFYDGLNAVKLVDAIVSSAQEQKWIKIR